MVSLNLPCICAIVSSLSSRYFSAVTKIFGILMDRKILERSLNHPCQYFSDYLRSTFQVYFCLPLYSTYLSWGGMETLAESVFRRVFDCRLHLIAASGLSKYFGLSDRIWFMKGKASIAVPSTTSITTEPTILGYFSTLVRISVTRTDTEPPIECPISTTFLSGYLAIICLRTSIVSFTNVSMERSSKFLSFFDEPCPLKSKAITVPNRLT